MLEPLEPMQLNVWINERDVIIRNAHHVLFWTLNQECKTMNNDIRLERMFYWVDTGEFACHYLSVYLLISQKKTCISESKEFRELSNNSHLKKVVTMNFQSEYFLSTLILPRHYHSRNFIINCILLNLYMNMKLNINCIFSKYPPKSSVEFWYIRLFLSHSVLPFKPHFHETTFSPKIYI